MPFGGRKSASGIDDEMRPQPLFSIRYLLGQYDGKPLGRHARTLHQALFLHSFRRDDECHSIDLSVQARLKQQRNVKNDEPYPLFLRFRQEGGAPRGHQRMDDRLEPSRAPPDR